MFKWMSQQRKGSAMFSVSLRRADCCAAGTADSSDLRSLEAGTAVLFSLKKLTFDRTFASILFIRWDRE